MRLEQLHAFLAVAEVKNFQEAAHRCGVTQSTISRQIQSLELSVGTPLFLRNKRVSLTLAGERFFPRARKICQEWNSATDEITALLSGKQPELCIAVIHSVGAYYLPPVLQRFCADYPDVQLRVTALGSDRALKVLRDGLVDFAIVMQNRFLAASSELVMEPLYEESVQVLMAANHPLASQVAVDWADLAKYPHVLFKDGYGMQRLVKEQFQRQGLSLRVGLEVNTLDAFRGIVRPGNLIALLAEGAIFDAGQDPTLAVRPTTDPVLKRQVVSVTTVDRLAIPPIQHFRQLVSEMMGNTGGKPPFFQALDPVA